MPENVTPQETKNVPEENLMSKQEEEKRAKKKTAWLTLKEIAEKHQDPKLKNALMVVRPSLYGIASSHGVSTRFIELVISKNQISEDEVFKLFKIGRRECASHIRSNLKRAEPGARVWIAFDPSSGMYKVAGKGPKAPQGWTGYVPAEEIQVLK
jgi:ABC-type sugar transport system ATPase subunit